MIMEFNEKLQELRKQKGLTQEELAESLFVSRTAISKWEEVLNIAEEDNKRKEKYFRTLVFGLLDCSVAMLLFFPFFGEKSNGIVTEVSLLFLNSTASYLRNIYYITVIAIVVYGILTLAFQNCQKWFWEQNRDKISLVFNVIAVLLFIISAQPYAATFLFVFLMIRVQSQQ